MNRCTRPGGRTRCTATPRQAGAGSLEQGLWCCTAPPPLCYLNLDGEELLIRPLPHHGGRSIQVLVGLSQRLEQREQLPELEREVLGHEVHGKEAPSGRR